MSASKKSLTQYGYAITFSNELRRKSLEDAVKNLGVDLVIHKLTELKLILRNINYVNARLNEDFDYVEELMKTLKK